MEILDVQAKILQLKLAGLTRIQIADRIGISDVVFDNVSRSMESNKGAIKKYIRNQVMRMNISELDNLKIDGINFSSVIARLEFLYKEFGNIPNDNKAYLAVTEFAKSKRMKHSDVHTSRRLIRSR